MDNTDDLIQDNTVNTLGISILENDRKDMLRELFNLQYILTNRYFQQEYGASLDKIAKLPFSPTGDRVKEAVITYSCDMIAEEAFELKRNFNYKTWKKWRPVDEAAAKEELVDIWHFVLQVSLEMGLTPDDLMEAFRKKNQKNHQRQDSGTY